MSTRDLALAGIEQAINTVIGLDPAAARNLAARGPGLRSHSRSALWRESSVT